MYRVIVGFNPYHKSSTVKSFKTLAAAKKHIAKLINQARALGSYTRIIRHMNTIHEFMFSSDSATYTIAECYAVDRIYIQKVEE